MTKEITLTEILKFFFDRITDPLGLPINALYEHIIILVISQLAFRCAYRFIGDLYCDGYISGGKIGSILHWIVRALFYFVFWAITYGAIVVGKWIIANKYIFITAVGIVLVLIIAAYAGVAIKNRKTAE